MSASYSSNVDSCTVRDNSVNSDSVSRRFCIEEEEDSGLHNNATPSNYNFCQENRLVTTPNPALNPIAYAAFFRMISWV
jgi:hypothetical protein